MRIFTRPSPSVWAGAVPLLLIAAICGAVTLIPSNGHDMKYVGLAMMLFFPILVLFGVGVTGSIYSFFLSIERDNGIAWPLLLLAANLTPFLMMLAPLLRR